MVIKSGMMPIDGMKTRRLKVQSTAVTVNWTWYDEAQGVVSWNFANNSNKQVSVILYRNSYYFGNAFWPVYVQNGMTSWATELTPLIDEGVEKNTVPIGIIDFGNGNRIIAFIFTLAQGQKWSILEGGFSSITPPQDAEIYEVSLEKSGSFCIGYDNQQVLDWDLQTQTAMLGYSPDPSYIETVEVMTPEGTDFVALFNDTISDSTCPPPPNCFQEIEQGFADGNVDEIVNGIYCAIEQGIEKDKLLGYKLITKIMEKFLKSIL